MAVLLLHTSGHGPEDQNIYFQGASGLMLPPIRLRVLLENILSGHFRVHSMMRMTDRPQLLGEALRKKKKASLVNWPISGRGINLEHGQGQLPRQRAQRCTGLSGGRVGRQGQEKFCGRTVGVVVLVDVMIEILHLSCVRLKRTWKIMWSRRNSRTEVAKSLRTETQKRYVFLKYLCVALREGCPS